MRFLRRAADVTASGSLSTKLRQKRHSFFLSLLARLSKPTRILDVGGTENFWRMMSFPHDNDVEITLLNLTYQAVTLPQFVSVVGDARDMTQFRDGEFDIVFSNSVMEHVGGYDDQQNMAQQIRRVGERYFVQTPNKWFPIEPHFLVPGFQFLPVAVRAFLRTYFDLAWERGTGNYEEARAQVKEIRLLSKRELRNLFPDGQFYEERILGLIKSFVVYGGWDTASD